MEEEIKRIIKKYTDDGYFEYEDEALAEIAKWVYEELLMEGEFAKLTPFQQTVNTYLKNRAEELGIIKKS